MIFIIKTLFIFLIPLQVMGFSILIDPGHGGEDKGTTQVNYRYEKGKKIKVSLHEKDIALIIAKKIHQKLKNKNFNVYLTRSLDRTVTLDQRAQMAEKIKADLFISIHVNSGRNIRAGGFETYYLDNHSDIAVKKVENIENKGLVGDELIINQILTDLVIERTVKSSKGLAQSIHSEIKKGVSVKFKIKDRGIKPGLFYVLALSKRPGVLLEVGFLSNPRERRKISSGSFQDFYTDSVVKGIQKFIKKNSKNFSEIF